MRKFILSFAIFLFAGNVFAAELDNKSCVGEVTEYKGILKIFKEKDFRGSIVTDNNTKLFSGYALKTGRKSEAKIVLIDKTGIILTEKSSLTFPQYNKIIADNGTVLFKVTKRDEVQGFTVQTKTATIGVKGTQFAVAVDNESVKVFCKEGSVGVKSLKGEFKRYVKKELDEYNQFLKDQFQDYTQYKKELKEEFVKYVKEFDMKPNMAVVISDSNEVKNIDFPENISELFEELNKF
ncbi:FecR family protein [Deferribacterales bacterium Es71-Z0220]|jgi:hypothetical protein|uniref:FecR family protein n=1 Tax=Deferrivibrio essentukiensis TaxID=2880922 RepID=UPI001F60AA5B|nr:FecR family protein [Deferrivibrio essentukiensis]MBZ4672297.1 FecR protein [Deferribacteraceae bacterium]MCB4204695.1 FecR family protein [Deferrivibrio essentukiensis]